MIGYGDIMNRFRTGSTEASTALDQGYQNTLDQFRQMKQRDEEARSFQSAQAGTALAGQMGPGVNPSTHSDYFKTFWRPKDFSKPLMDLEMSRSGQKAGLAQDLAASEAGVMGSQLERQQLLADRDFNKPSDLFSLLTAGGMLATGIGGIAPIIGGIAGAFGGSGGAGGSGGGNPFAGTAGYGGN